VKSRQSGKTRNVLEYPEIPSTLPEKPPKPMKHAGIARKNLKRAF
jgi:hypothetical protein